MHLFGIILIIGAVVITYQSNKLITQDCEKERLEIIKKYEIKIIKLDSINTTLIKKEKLMQSQIDSLENVKQKIIIKYDEKIKSIYNASANEHAIWLDSTVAKVNRLKK